MGGYKSKMMPASRSILQITRHRRSLKALHTLRGLLEGCLADARVADEERRWLEGWMDAQDDIHDVHPFTELFPALRALLRSEAGTAELEEVLHDVAWLCAAEVERLEAPATPEIQVLLGLIAGIAADGRLCDTEVTHLRAWLSDHDHLQAVFPYDELRAMLVAALHDGKVEAEEREGLLSFFREFARVDDHRVVEQRALSTPTSLVGVCAVQPEIVFEGNTFCFTGAFTRHRRADLASVVSQLGGGVSNSVTPRVRYLIVGAEGNPCWAHACYGRKVEAAVQLRRTGVLLQIVHENDFLDAVLDAGGTVPTA